MPSPFPGMIPFLEQEDAWSDFHERFIPAAAEEIGRQVEPSYIVKIDQNVYVHEIPDQGRQLLGRPDIYIAKPQTQVPLGAAGAVLAPPARARLVPLTITESECFIEIRDRTDRQLITAVELLSPANKKAGSDRDQYLAKRNRYLQTRVHLVEIDLLRGGRRVPLEPPPTSDYCVVVSRAEDRPAVEVWPIAIRAGLPVIPVPLRQPDGDAQLDLQAVLNRVYDGAGYRHYIYGFQPDPPLTADDQQWAEEILGRPAKD